MNGNTNNKSDLGFLVFLILAIIILIPLGIGFDNFESLFKTIKITLGVVFGITILGLVIGGYFLARKKIMRGKKIKSKNEQNNQSNKNKTQMEEDDKANKVKIEIIDETQDILEQEQTQKEIDNLSIKLKKLNNEFEL